LARGFFFAAMAISDSNAQNRLSPLIRQAV
jgi:hypothetical protein